MTWYEFLGGNFYFLSDIVRSFEKKDGFFPGFFEKNTENLQIGDKISVEKTENFDAFKAIFLQIGDKKGEISVEKVGYFLRKFENREEKGLKFVKGKKKRQGMEWAVRGRNIDENR